MMIVADTSPLNYLILIEQIELLHRLFHEINIPDVVQLELVDCHAPKIVREWITAPPAWIKIHSTLRKASYLTDELDPGEAAAILLSLELKADLVLLDDMKARTVAKKAGLKITGLLGILGQAAQMQLIDITDAIKRLKDTSFWASESLFEELLTRFS